MRPCFSQRTEGENIVRYPRESGEMLDRTYTGAYIPFSLNGEGSDMTGRIKANWWLPGSSFGLAVLLSAVCGPAESALGRRPASSPTTCVCDCDVDLNDLKAKVKAKKW